MRRQLKQCVSYADSPKQFAKPIGSFQAVSHRIADMRLRLGTTSRLMLYRFARLLDARRRNTTRRRPDSELHLSESLVQSGLSALEIHRELRVHGGLSIQAQKSATRKRAASIQGRRTCSAMWSRIPLGL